MDRHTALILLDVGYVITLLFSFAAAATDAIIRRLTQRSSKLILAFVVIFALGIIFSVYRLFSEMTSSNGVRAPVTIDQMSAFGFLFGQLILPLILGTVYAVTNITLLAGLRAQKQRLLKQLQLQSLAHQHPEAAATVEALTNVLEKQSRTGLLQSIILGAFFYVLGIITPYLIGGIAR